LQGRIMKETKINMITTLSGVNPPERENMEEK
jgi:hypothetical protein